MRLSNSSTEGYYSINLSQDNFEKTDKLKVVIEGLSAQDLQQPLDLSRVRALISDALAAIRNEQAIQHGFELQPAPGLLGVEFSCKEAD